MKKRSFNADWLCARKDDERNAVKVCLPHDAMLYEARSRKTATGGACGYFPGGCYVYTKRFTAPKEWREQSVIAEFEGVYQNASVFLNGTLLAERPYGYSNFFADLSSALSFEEENELKVIADNSRTPNSRWYSGSGIYRSVNLYLGAKSHLVPDGLRIDAGQDGTVKFHAETTGGDELKVRLLQNGEEVASGSAFVQNGTAELTLQVRDPALWDAEHPNLYVCEATLFDRGKAIDTDTVEFGFRTLSWSGKGFFVNGKEVLFRGACVHHDNGILGAACFEAAEERRVRLLKEAGFNAIRSAHNPASKAMLRACDRLGMYVMDEAFDMWLIHKNPYDYGKEQFGLWWEKDLEAMIRKDWSHPSVVLYSLGNEISELGVPEGQKLCKDMAEKVRQLDPSRAVTMGINLMLAAAASKGKGVYGEGKSTGSASLDKIPTSQFFNLLMNRLGGVIDNMSKSRDSDKVVEAVSGLLDMPGYNYARSRYEKEAALYPDRPFTGSETLPKFLYKNWQLVKALPGLTGDFMWTGWDYLGEAAIGTVQYKSYKKTAETAPIISGGCGVIDICGKLRPETIWNRLIWGLREQPGIGVEPLTHAGDPSTQSIWRDTDAVESWSWAGCEGKKTTVTVYASGAYAELLVNGKSLGRKKTEEYKAVYKKVAYEPGTITAVSLDESGRELGRSSLSTAEGKTRLTLRAEKTNLCADGQDLCYLNIELTGEDGTVKSAEDRAVTVEVTGAGTLLALGSARPNMSENFISPTHTTYYGKALAVIRAGTEAGEILVKVKAPGLEEQRITIIEQ